MTDIPTPLNPPERLLCGPGPCNVSPAALAAMQRPLPRVAVIVDTSGSVSGDLLSLAWTEVHGCLRHLSVRRDLLAVPGGKEQPLDGDAVDQDRGDDTDTSAQTLGKAGRA